MSHPKELAAPTRKYPFKHMRLADHRVLDSIDGRFNCSQCSRSRKFFCYSCYVPVGDLDKLFPKVQIPLEIHIIKHKKEIDGKSTAAHAAILAPDRVRIYTYPDIPDYLRTEFCQKTVLIFPGAKSVTVAQLFNRNIRLNMDNNYGLPMGTHMGTLLRKSLKQVIAEQQAEDAAQLSYDFDNLPVQRAVFIDSTWNQSRSIFKDERVRALRTVVLQNRCSQFWRHQRGSPRWYLATIEAIHQFLLEVHVNAWGLNPLYRGLDNLELQQDFYAAAHFKPAPADCTECAAPYNGQYDNLMFFFANMYDLIHKYYDHNELKSYRRPI